MELTRYTSPCDCGAALRLWEDTFGAAEAALEAPQLDGSENAHNLDILYLATEGDTLLGTIHATIPHNCPTIAGLSGMCTVPAARGTGLGRILFTKILEEIDSLGVEVSYLGTGNPIAAKLYHSLGFSFLPGSNVMVRYKRGDTVDFTHRVFDPTPTDVQLTPGSPALRIPLIPLVLHRGSLKVLDRNAGLMSSREMLQASCMGLYPKYAALPGFWGAVSGSGVLGAIASIAPADSGETVADFFCCDSFADTVPALLDTCRIHGASCLHIADHDTVKQSLVRKLGYRPCEATTIRIGAFTLPATVYRKDL